MDVNDLVLVFNQYFQQTNHRIYFVYGPNHEIEEIIRPNEDENFPQSYSFGTYIVSTETKSDRIRLISLNYEELGIIEFALTGISNEIENDWTNYLKRTIDCLKEAGHCIKNGMDILLYNNFPNEEGLSSTRTIEALTAAILKTQHETN